MQLLGGLVIELRVGAQKCQECLKVTFKPHFVDDLLHRVANALHLLQSEAVHLVRCHTSRCK